MKSILFLHNHSKLEVTYLLGSTTFPEIVTTGITHYSIFCRWSQPKPSFATGLLWRGQNSTYVFGTICSKKSSTVIWKVYSPIKNEKKLGNFEFEFFGSLLLM